MKKFIFKMNNLLEFKEQIENNKKAHYVQALKKYRTEKQKLDNYIINKKKIINQKNKVSENSTILDLKHYSLFLTHVNKKIEKQKEVVFTYQQELDNRKKELIEASKEKRMLEKLKERHYENYLYEVKKEEDKITDELVSFKNSKN
ncbi:flagellar export protein FliJ [Thermohalobacter berrensis]|uniref:Flagellar FliJ protein n=1 Tax=Thermohalobacter berrensis TaxID=99594 RepID=A0A419TAD5_9FIRM|nr:flagellar export protein FliJ [Thermohalobacter berrensis]RKD34436.1 flagellar export protein FliJ [Thermohalobacter berrensis]